MIPVPVVGMEVVIRLVTSVVMLCTRSFMAVTIPLTRSERNRLRCAARLSRLGHVEWHGQELVPAGLGYWIPGEVDGLPDAVWFAHANDRHPDPRIA